MAKFPLKTTLSVRLLGRVVFCKELWEQNHSLYPSVNQVIISDPCEENLNKI